MPEATGRCEIHGKLFSPSEQARPVATNALNAEAISVAGAARGGSAHLLETFGRAGRRDSLTLLLLRRRLLHCLLCVRVSRSAG